MKNSAFLMFFLLFLVSPAAAQFISPVPIIETEVRDRSSVKLRSIELERVKREARKKTTEKLGRAAVNNFLEIKADFEKIQKLENDIVAVYKTGTEIDYRQIAALSGEITQSASRLKENLFPAQNKEEKNSSNEEWTSAKAEPQPVKNLIVELDNAIAAFISNPIFSNSPKPGLKDKEKAEADLERVITSSAALKLAAEKSATPKN